jgi:hypothetical protein
VNVLAPPRSPPSDDRQDLDPLDALIEEARRRARRRRRRNGAAALLVVAAGVAAFIGFGRGGAGGNESAALARAPGMRAPRQTALAAGGVLVTLRGYVAAARTLHPAGGPVHYRESGRFTVVWRIPSNALTGDRTFRSISASVRGRTSAIFDNAPARSCRGTLSVRRGAFLLRVVRGDNDPYLSAAPISFDASPSPIATATSGTCARGMLAGRWRLTALRGRQHPPFSVAAKRRAQEWWVYNHPGGSFYGKNFIPTPKGGASDGWIADWGPAGSFRWLAVFRVHRFARLAHREATYTGGGRRESRT